VTGPSGVCRIAPVRAGVADWGAARTLVVKPAADRPMSARQRQIVAFIADYTAAYGYPPTYREIGAAVGLRSLNTVRYQLGRLAELGVLEGRPAARRARTLRLVGG
jgi:SOS-response transcriptional repressor LexA